MTRFNHEPVPVVIGACECPGTPHGDGDVVYLAAKLPLAAGMAAQAAIVAAEGDTTAAAESMARIYLRYCVTGWNLLDEDGKPVPLEPENLTAALTSETGLAERADELYAEVILRPLLARLSSRSRTGSTGATTSPPATPIRKRSGRSSPAGSAASRPSIA